MINISMKPVITEKSMNLAAKGVYMFDVSPNANKPLIASAAKEQFNVDVERVRISITKGKIKNFKGKVGQRKDIKRAFVTVKQGQKISVFDIQSEEKK